MNALCSHATQLHSHGTHCVQVQENTGFLWEPVMAKPLLVQRGTGAASTPPSFTTSLRVNVRKAQANDRTCKHTYRSQHMFLSVGHGCEHNAQRQGLTLSFLKTR